MGLTLKNEEQEKVVEKKLEDLSDDYISGKESIDTAKKDYQGEYINNPVVISTTVAMPVAQKQKNEFDAMAVVKWIVIIAIVIVGFKLISGVINPKSTDITGYVDMEASELEAKLDLDFETNCDMNTRITHYSNGTVTVDGDGEIGVVYIDGKRKGVHIDHKKYNMYGISIGDPEYKVEDKLRFEYDDSFNVLNDMAGGQSTANFYFNTMNNDCLVVIVNDKSARVVAITYFNDYKLISENLSGLD